MSILERLTKTVSQILEIPEKEVTPDLAIGSVEKWDSLGHLNLILAIEDEFGVKFRTEEILELTSIEDITKALKQKL